MLNSLESETMNVLRCTVVDSRGGASFIIHGDALAALVAACCQNPATLEDLLDLVEPNYQRLRDYVLAGLTLFDEHNTPGNYQAIHQTLRELQAHEQPPFRVVDEVTREASLRPVKAGAILINLRAKRIIQLVNTYREIQRRGRGRAFNGEEFVNAVFQYDLPEEWSLVP